MGITTPPAAVVPLEVQERYIFCFVVAAGGLIRICTGRYIILSIPVVDAGGAAISLGLASGFGTSLHK